MKEEQNCQKKRTSHGYSWERLQHLLKVPAEEKGPRKNDPPEPKVAHWGEQESHPAAVPVGIRKTMPASANMAAATFTTSRPYRMSW